jgi:hypothetical protein
VAPPGGVKCRDGRLSRVGELVESTWRQLHVTAAASSSPPSLRPVCCRLLDGHPTPNPSQTAYIHRVSLFSSLRTQFR